MTVNYGGGGSGKGRTDLASGTVQFAGSDSPIPSDETSSFKGKTVLYFPVIIGPITVSYNLSGVTEPELTPTVIANIFQGKITKWNDPAIASVNSGVKLPSTAITIARRSDSSGTTANFSAVPEDATKAWKLGSSSTINWPSSSRGGNGNGGVAQIVKSTPGAIGYVDYADAKASGLSFAVVQNTAGKYIAPSTDGGVRRRGRGQGRVQPDVRRGLGGRRHRATRSPTSRGTWSSKADDCERRRRCSRRTSATCSETARSCSPALSYAPLPASIDQKAKAQLSKITS